MRKFLCLIILMSLFSCGFQVMYRDEENNLSHASELASIRIKKDRDHLSQKLKNNLYDLLNPDYIQAEAKYFLILKVSESNYGALITQTGASGRNTITVDVHYELKNLENAMTISQGSTAVSDSYDVSTNRYGTYVADETVQLNLTKIAAQNIRNALVNDLIEVRKRCEGGAQDQVDDEDDDEEEFVCPLSKKLSKKPIK